MQNKVNKEDKGEVSWNPRLRLTVLGARGSMAVSGKEYLEFGGATSCYLVEAGDEQIILDAGTGILNAPQSSNRTPTILVSHLHLDHLMGLGMYGRLSCPNKCTRLFLPALSDAEAVRNLNRLYAPPLWPLELLGYGGDLEIRAMPWSLQVGEATVRSIAGSHPGGCLVIKVSYRGKSIVYATDYEYEPSSFARLVEFARDADLVLFDGQYSEEELPSHRGFGHATPRIGLDLLRQSGAKQLLVIHHDPRSTDEILLQRERQLGSHKVRFAREGEAITL